MKKMKILIKILTVFLVLVFTSCIGEKLKHIVIISKSNEGYFNEPLKDGYCRFFYKEYENAQWIEFKDKCEKYNVGDTIVGNSKKY